MGLGTKIKTTLVEWFNTILDIFWKALTWPITNLIDGLTGKFIKDIKNSHSNASNNFLNYGFDKRINDIFTNATTDVHGLGGLYWIIGISFGLVVGLISAVVSVGSRTVGIFWNRILRNQLPDLQTTINSYFRGHATLQDIFEVGWSLGLQTTFIEDIIESQRSLLNPEMLRDLFLRGNISDKDLTIQLKQFGYNDRDIELFKKLNYDIPPVQDIITMAVREAFTPDIAEKFGQYDDYPAEFEKWAKEKGLSDFWSKNYWAAHWSLPSIQQGYEMYQRGVINKSELEMLFRALDIMPFWRDKLLEISFNPFTRVDVRRMYKLGVLNKSEVKRAYLDLGYNEGRANKMTEFTILNNMNEDKELTKADILDAYKRRAIDKDIAIKYLALIGYSKEAINLFISKVDASRQIALKKALIENVKLRYEKGIIDEREAIARLSNENIPSNEINELLKIWDVTRGKNIFTPAISDLKKWFSTKLITESEFRNELINKGVSSKYIDLFVKEIKK